MIVYLVVDLGQQHAILEYVVVFECNRIFQDETVPIIVPIVLLYRIVVFIQLTSVEF